MSVVRSTRELNQVKIETCNKNKKIVHQIEAEILKESECTREVGSIIERMQRETKRSKVNVIMKYSNSTPKSNLISDLQPRVVHIKKKMSN